MLSKEVQLLFFSVLQQVHFCAVEQTNRNNRDNCPSIVCGNWKCPAVKRQQKM